jgi:hypothetical protein
MYRNFFVILATFLGIVAAGCGNAASNETNTARLPVNQANAANAPNAEQPSAATSNTSVTAVNAPPGTAPRPAAAPPGGQTFELGSKDGPAPDDSVVTSALGENFVQTRTFRSHPQLSKVERIAIFEGGKPKYVIKVYLKNGQVKEVSPTKLADPLTAPAATILKAIQ